MSSEFSSLCSNEVVTIIAINTFLMDNQGARFLNIFFTASRNLNFLKHLKIMPKFKEGTANRLTVILYYLEKTHAPCNGRSLEAVHLDAGIKLMIE